MELSGKVIQIINERRKNDSDELELQEFILQPESSKNVVKLTLFGGKAAKYAVKVDDEVNALVNVLSKEINGNWFTTVYVNYLIKDSERFSMLKRENGTKWKFIKTTNCIEITKPNEVNGKITLSSALEAFDNCYCSTAQLELAIRKGWVVQNADIISLTDTGDTYRKEGMVIFKEKQNFQKMFTL